MKIISFDIESCTGGSRDAGLCEFGYCVSDSRFETIVQRNLLVNPAPPEFKLGKPGEERWIQLHYPDEEYRKYPDFSARYEEVAELFQGEAVAVGFEIGNDLQYLNDACDFYHKDRIAFSYLDVKLLYRILTMKYCGCGLNKLAEEFGIDYLEHRADEDARATLLVMKTILEKLKISLADAIAKYGIRLGDNGAAEPEPCTSQFLYDSGIDFVKGSKRNRILVEEFRESLHVTEAIAGSEFKGKKVCLNCDLEYGDALLSRKVIQKLVNSGAKCFGRVQKANVFVFQKGLSGCKRTQTAQDLVRQGKKILMLEQQEFLAKLGDLPELAFDDERILRERKKRLKKEKYRREAVKREQAQQSIAATVVQKQQTNL